MRDYLDIVRRNLLSPIVIAIFLLAAGLLYVKEYRDAWFISVVIVVNSIIGIVQEIRAKRVLKKLELLSAPKARLLRGDEEIEVPYDQLTVGDKVAIRAGDELPADVEVVVSKGLEINESLLTGESAAVEKTAGDVALASTTVLAGEGIAKVIATGDDTKAGLISKRLKHYKPELTPLQQAIWHAITYLTYGAIFLSALVFVSYSWLGYSPVVILKTITSASVVVVPEGLLLASSLLLAFGSLKLAQVKVLPQKLSAIEAMALLNMLAVDKTGTLTSDEVILERFESFDTATPIDSLAALVADEASGGNITGTAILAAAQPAKNAEITSVMAFSSGRKMAGVRAKIAGKTRTLVMGAPEFVEKICAVDADKKRQIDEWAAEGLRVLLLAEFSDQKTPIAKLTSKTGRAIGAVILRNSLRDGVQKTVEFLQDQGVTIKVISGDNPKTVSYIAQSAGIRNANTYITGAELAKMNEEEFNRTADTTTIFARVLPDQKERLVARFQAAKNFTGMVGDGVNDALALKKADLGVAMYAGAPASRRVADIILLNNSFTSLPIGMKFGNRIMQAIEVIAILFFHKIIYGTVLLLTTISLSMKYPYEPRHITFMNIFLVTMPTIMWTLFPPEPKHRINPKHFWRDTLRAVVPIALLTGATVAFTYWIGLKMHPQNVADVSTMTVLVATLFGVYLVFLAGPMLGVVMDKKATIARALYTLAAIIVAVTSFGIRPLRSFFDFTSPDVQLLWPAGGVVLAVMIVQWLIARAIGKKFVMENLAAAKKEFINVAPG